jgi:hypothetical protein
MESFGKPCLCLGGVPQRVIIWSDFSSWKGMELELFSLSKEKMVHHNEKMQYSAKVLHNVQKFS